MGNQTLSPERKNKWEQQFPNSKYGNCGMCDRKIKKNQSRLSPLFIQKISILVCTSCHKKIKSRHPYKIMVENNYKGSDFKIIKEDYISFKYT